MIPCEPSHNHESYWTDTFDPLPVGCDGDIGGGLRCHFRRRYKVLGKCSLVQPLLGTGSWEFPPAPDCSPSRLAWLTPEPTFFMVPFRSLHSLHCDLGDRSCSMGATGRLPSNFPRPHRHAAGQRLCHENLFCAGAPHRPQVGPMMLCNVTSTRRSFLCG